MTRIIRLALALAVATLALVAGATTASAETTWLCKPGLASNPCDYGLRTTVFSPAGERQGVERVARPKDPGVDCFYVYPTVSDQPTLTANLEIGPELRSIAVYQASRYSQLCRVYAPVYRQITLAGLLRPDEVTPAMRERALADVKAAWRDYLRTFNDGRGVILIGHSQGTYVLRELIADEIDRDARVRRRIVSALLLGGGVTVKEGADRGGDFRHLRACRQDGQVGCVIAFSTYNAPVDPAIARFGRTAEKGREILCTNPASLAGGAGDITPEMPTQPFGGTVIASQVSQLSALVPRASTPWIAVPRAYRARCTGGAGGANVLAITPRGGAPVFPSLPEPGWGLHLADANIALRDLTDLVRSQAAGWLEGRRAGG
ncbi:MAG TPA: DUF3089 domain-containing protein [Capillimicrobium sp.]|jgi:pimeloyl-ACP methyl ester carboxylesterase